MKEGDWMKSESGRMWKEDGGCKSGDERSKNEDVIAWIKLGEWKGKKQEDEFILSISNASQELKI